VLRPRPERPPRGAQSRGLSAGSRMAFAWHCVPGLGLRERNGSSVYVTATSGLGSGTS
jgi:hypothetical protein